ncbi:MAG: cytochrome c [Myxococcales bacterium]|nr:cytochrome c [Myxococcales bacterium]
MKAAFLLVVVVGCSGDASGGSVEGPKIFETMCASCHGPGGKPTEQMVARMNVRDLTAPEFRARVTKELVAEQVRKGSANKLMPPLETALKPEQIEAVAAWVASPDFVKGR